MRSNIKSKLQAQFSTNCLIWCQLSGQVSLVQDLNAPPVPVMEPGEFEAQGSSITQSALMLRTCGRKGSTDRCFTYYVSSADLWTALVFTKFTTMVLQMSWIPPHEGRFEFRSNRLTGMMPWWGKLEVAAQQWPGSNYPKTSQVVFSRLRATSGKQKLLPKECFGLEIIRIAVTFCSPFTSSCPSSFSTMHFFLFLNGYLCLVFLFDTFSSQNLPLSNFWHFFFKLNFFARIFSVEAIELLQFMRRPDSKWGCEEMAIKLSAQSCIDAVCNRISQQATSRSFLIFALMEKQWLDLRMESFCTGSFACGRPQRHVLGIYLTALAFCSTALLFSLRTHKIHQPELVLQHGTPLWALWMTAMPGSKTGLSILSNWLTQVPNLCEASDWAMRFGLSTAQILKPQRLETLRTFFDVRHGAGGRRRWQAQANLVQL